MGTPFRRAQLLAFLVYSFLLAGLVSAGTLRHRNDAASSQNDGPIANQTLYKPLFPKHSNSTPKFNPDKLPVRPSAPSNARVAGAASSDTGTSPVYRLQQEEGTCGPGMPCVNGACCSAATGLCGYVRLSEHRLFCLPLYIKPCFAFRPLGCAHWITGSRLTKDISTTGRRASN